MRKVGLNGKSVMPMISGFCLCRASYICRPGILKNKKERLLTILVTPLMSLQRTPAGIHHFNCPCNPNKYYFGFLNLQGLVMMGLYLLGLVMALIVSYVFKVIIKLKEKSYFILELPVYRPPR
jgi:ferrous iron transport protein B